MLINVKKGHVAPTPLLPFFEINFLKHGILQVDNRRRGAAQRTTRPGYCAWFEHNLIATSCSIYILRGRGAVSKAGFECANQPFHIR